MKRCFARLGLARFFDTIVDSTEVGIEKPDVRIFEHALREMKVAAAEAVYVGDVFKVDVLGARAAGLRPILFDPHGFHADKTCDSDRGPRRPGGVAAVDRPAGFLPDR